MESLVLSREAGDGFILTHSGRCVIQVPSAVIREEWNYLVDPDSIGQLTWLTPRLFRFDPRLLDVQSRI